MKKFLGKQVVEFKCTVDGMILEQKKCRCYSVHGHRLDEKCRNNIDGFCRINIVKIFKHGIKPCPFCGQTVDPPIYLDLYANNNPWSIGCNECNFSIDDETEEKVILRWNTRKKDDAEKIQA